MGNHGSDQHVVIQFPVEHASSTLQIRMRNDFGYSLDSQLPALGSASHGLSRPFQIVEAESLTLDVSGSAWLHL